MHDPQTGLDRRHGIAALRPHTGDEQGQGRGERADTFNFFRVGRTHYQTQLTIEVPRTLCQLGDVFIHQGLAIDGGESLVL